MRRKRLGISASRSNRSVNRTRSFRCCRSRIVFLLPSSQESFGLAALEAMACEVPVVASRVGGLHEVIDHGVTGFLHDPDDIDGMAADGVKLLTDRNCTSASLPPAAARGAEALLPRSDRAAIRKVLRRGPEFLDTHCSRRARGDLAQSPPRPPRKKAVPTGSPLICCSEGTRLARRSSATSAGSARARVSAKRTSAPSFVTNARTSPIFDRLRIDRSCGHNCC